MYHTNCIYCFAPLNGSAVCPRCGFDHGVYVPQPHHLRPGTVLQGRYVVGRAMGQGGFGITYAGFDPNMKRRVAIKEFYPNGVASRDASQTDVVTCTGTGNIAENFRLGVDKCVQEAQSLAQLDDIPGVVRGLDQFQYNNTAYIIMEFVEGVTLRDYLRQRLPHKPDFREAAELLAPIGTALQKVHARGYVHRDVSPDNIMINTEDEPKLLDFGAVKMVVSDDGGKTEHPIVKRGFSPIEMYSTEGELGSWSDVYAYCATLYFILVGYSADEPSNRIYRETLGARLANVASPAQISVLEKGMALSPQDRYQKMSELLPALAACKEDPAPVQDPAKTVPVNTGIERPADPIREAPREDHPIKEPVIDAPRKESAETEPVKGAPRKESAETELVGKSPRKESDETKLIDPPSQDTVVIKKTVPKQREPERPKQPQPEMKAPAKPMPKQPEQATAPKAEQIGRFAPQPKMPPQAASTTPGTERIPPVTPAQETPGDTGSRQPGANADGRTSPPTAGGKKKIRVIIAAVTAFVALCVVIGVLAGKSPDKASTTTTTQAPSTTQAPVTTQAPSITQAQNAASDNTANSMIDSVFVGDYVEFGSYEQDNNTSNGKEAIEWLVLAKENGKALLISRYGLDSQPYNETRTNVTWETCTLRTWLNGTFLNSAFSADEQSAVSYSTVTADGNPDYSTSPGNDTTDRIFLLSIMEAEQYFSTDEVRECKPTAYAKAQGAIVDHNTGVCFWWLRSPGVNSDIAANVEYHNRVFRSGTAVNISEYAVRPALWVDLASLSDTQAPSTTSTTQVQNAASGNTANSMVGSVSVGDYVKFGSYEQDNNTSNGKEAIEWLVLAKEDGKALLISRYGLDCQPYNTEYTSVTWETCTLRTWLKGTFLNDAFSAEEQNKIPYSTVTADRNPEYNTDPGNDATNKIFLLSITEAERYFSSDEARKCQPTAYAKAQGAYVNADTGCCWWWLRSRGDYSYSAAYVSYGGHVRSSGNNVHYDLDAVRPALWINLNS